MEVNKLESEELLELFATSAIASDKFDSPKAYKLRDQLCAELLRRLEHGQGAQPIKFRECARAIAQGYSNNPELIEREEAWVYSMLHSYGLIPAAPPEQPQGSGEPKPPRFRYFIRGIEISEAEGKKAWKDKIGGLLVYAIQPEYGDPLPDATKEIAKDGKDGKGFAGLADRGKGHKHEGFPMHITKRGDGVWDKNCPDCAAALDVKPADPAQGQANLQMEARKMAETNGHILAKRWREWRESSEGYNCADGKASGEFLENRLWRAFMAGAAAPSLPSARYGIYIASKTKHAQHWKELRASGVPIISTWIDEAGIGETKSFEDLWHRCISETGQAERMIVYAEPGDDLKGALVEVGAALAHGTPVYVVGKVEALKTARNHKLVLEMESLEVALSSDKVSKEENHE